LIKKIIVYLIYYAVLLISNINFKRKLKKGEQMENKQDIFMAIYERNPDELFLFIAPENGYFHKLSKGEIEYGTVEGYLTLFGIIKSRVNLIGQTAVKDENLSDIEEKIEREFRGTKFERAGYISRRFHQPQDGALPVRTEEKVQYLVEEGNDAFITRLYKIGSNSLSELIREYGFR